MSAPDEAAFITTTWGENVISVSHVYRLYREFRDGRDSFEDADRDGRPCSCSSD